jgi:hypothetical protein
VAATTYDYRVRARNGEGSSAYSNVASATTDSAPPGPGTILNVASVVVSTDNVGGGNKVGRADVIVEDENGNRVEGATVSGDFSGTFTESNSGPTDAIGVAVLTTSGSAKGKLSVTFCATSVTASGYSSFTGSVCDSN